MERLLEDFRGLIVPASLVDGAQSTTAEQLIGIFDRFHAMNLRLVELFHRSRILVTPTNLLGFVVIARKCSGCSCLIGGHALPRLV